MMEDKGSASTERNQEVSKVVGAPGIVVIMYLAEISSLV